MTNLWDPRSPSLRPAIVCFADILGFRAMTESALKSGQQAEFLRRVKSSLAKAYDLVRDERKDDGPNPLEYFDMKVFTDNIVVAYPLHNLELDLGEPELGILMMLFAEVQASLAADGFFLRGAIALGYHYQDRDIAYGKALLEAVDLEKSGGPPRLAIAPSVDPLIDVQLESYGDGSGAPHSVELLEDPRDERLFVNYIELKAFNYFPDGPIDYDFLEAHRDNVCRGLSENISNPNVRSKYEWTGTYHNFVCRMIADRFLVKDPESADEEQLAISTEAQRPLKYLVPDECLPCQLSPRVLDARRLRQRLSTGSGRNASKGMRVIQRLRRLTGIPNCPLVALACKLVRASQICHR